MFASRKENEWGTLVKKRGVRLKVKGKRKSRFQFPGIRFKKKTKRNYSGSG
jgi:hypothetical protein